MGSTLRILRTRPRVGEEGILRHWPVATGVVKRGMGGAPQTFWGDVYSLAREGVKRRAARSGTEGDMRIVAPASSGEKMGCRMRRGRSSRGAMSGNSGEAGRKGAEVAAVDIERGLSNLVGGWMFSCGPDAAIASRRGKGISLVASRLKGLFRVSSETCSRMSDSAMICIGCVSAVKSMECDRPNLDVPLQGKQVVRARN